MNASQRTSASGMVAQQRMIEVIANNLANVTTTGFKRSRAAFQDIFYETMQGVRPGAEPGKAVVGPIQVGRGVRVAAVNRIHSQGPIETTERPLDLSIEGDGFLLLERPDQTIAYTRDGSLRVSEDGVLVTSDGYPLLPSIMVPAEATSITISPDGLVSAAVGNAGQAVELGRLELARFINPSGLLAIGQNQYVETAAAGEPIVGVPNQNGFGRLLQGALEASNVEIVQEITDMITAQRAYEINAKALRVSDDIMQATNELVI